MVCRCACLFTSICVAQVLVVLFSCCCICCHCLSCCRCLLTFCCTFTFHFCFFFQFRNTRRKINYKSRRKSTLKNIQPQPCQPSGPHPHSTCLWECVCATVCANASVPRARLQNLINFFKNQFQKHFRKKSNVKKILNYFWIFLLNVFKLYVIFQIFKIFVF